MPLPETYNSAEWEELTPKTPAPSPVPVPIPTSAFASKEWEEISAPPISPPAKPKVTDYSDIISRASKMYKVDPSLIRSVIKAESNFNPKAVSKAGAQGLTQLMPDTAKELGVVDPFDPEENIMAGVKYLSQNLERFGGDMSLALAAFNAGPGNVEEYGDVPPFPETQKYIGKVLESYEKYKKPSEVPPAAPPVEASTKEVLGAIATTEEPPSFMEEVIKPTLKEIGRGMIATPETAYSLLEGMVVWPISKVAGLTGLIAGEQEMKRREEATARWLTHKPIMKEAMEAGEVVGKGFEFIETPQRMASEELEGRGYHRAAYLTKLVSDLAMFKILHAVGTKAKGKIIGESIPKDVPVSKEAIDQIAEVLPSIKEPEMVRPAPARPAPVPISRLTETQKSIAREAIREVAEEQRVDLVAEATRRRQAEIERMARVEVPPEIPPEPIEPVIAEPLVKPIVEPAKLPIEPARPLVEPEKPIVKPPAEPVITLAELREKPELAEYVTKRKATHLEEVIAEAERMIKPEKPPREYRGEKAPEEAAAFKLADELGLRFESYATPEPGVVGAGYMFSLTEKADPLFRGKEDIIGTSFSVEKLSDLPTKAKTKIEEFKRVAKEPVKPVKAAKQKMDIEFKDNIKVDGLHSGKIKIDGKNIMTEFVVVTDGNIASIENIKIKPEFQKMGLGTKLHIELARNLDKHGMILESSDIQYGPGLKLWQSLERKGYAEKVGKRYRIKPDPLKKIEPVVKPEVPKVPIPEKPAAGLALRKGKEVSFSEYREIKKGKHKGRIRVTWPDGKWSVIDKADVLKWPEKVEIIPEKARPRIFRMIEPTKVVNTRGKEITLSRGEEFMAYDIGKGKIRLQDGKQVTIYEGELSKLRGQMLPPGEEPMAGMIGRREPVLTIKERDALRIKLRAEAKGARTALAAGKRELAKLHKAKIREIRERLKAGFAARVAKIKTTKEILQRRRSKIRAVQEHFGLSDVDLRSITKRDIRLMNNLEFKTFIGDIRIKAKKFAERQQAKNELIAHIKEKELDVENLRKAMKLPTIKNMTTEQFRKLDKALDPYKKRDVFLSVRKLETVDRTELKGIKTWREARERLSKTLGVPVEQLQSIKVSEFDRFRYETGLAERNPFYGMMVEETAKRMLTSQAEYLKIETETFALAKKIKPKGLLRRLIPQQKRVREFMEAPADKKADIKLTGVEAELAEYMTKHFSEAREYLIQIEAMRMGRENYFTHVRRGILEAIKEDGIIKAVKEQFESYKLDEQGFNILDRETGEILAMDKFFKFAMHRVGKIKPTENVVRAFLTYMRTFKKKQALDEITPLIDIYAHALTPRGMTKKGLLLHGNLIRFVKEWINTQKGRHITLAAKQNGKVDGTLRAIKMFTSLRDLGLNIPVSLATEIGEQVTTYQLLGKKKFAVGKFRQRQKQGKAIIEKYRSLIGKNPWKELVEPSKEIGDRLMEGIFILFRDASVRANKTFLLGALSKAEFRAGEIAPERLAALKTELGRYRMVQGMSSIIGATPEGKAYTQYKRWAIPILRTTVKNLGNLTKRVTGRKVDSAEFKRSALELYRLAEVTAVVMLAFSTARDEDDQSFGGKIANKAYREITTLIQALSPRMFLAAGRTAAFIEDLGTNLTLLLKAEEYKTKEGYKGIQKLKRQVTPVAISQFRGEKKKEPTRRRAIRPTRRTRTTGR